MLGRTNRELNNLANDSWHDFVEALGSTDAARRANTAWQALSGRSTTRTWPTVRAAAIGIALGWAASELYRRRHDEIDQALKDAKHTVDDRLAVAKATPGSPIDKAKAAMSGKATTPIMATAGTPNAMSSTIGRDVP